MGEDAALQIRPQFSLNMKWERVFSRASALEKGLQVIDQNPIEEMALWLSSLVGASQVVKVG